MSRSGLRKLLVCTDLDRTLIPNGAQPESPGARERFGRFVKQPQVTLAYVSGRDEGLVREAIAAYGLPMPDWVVGDVGTTIYRVEADRWLPWRSWQEEIAPSWRGLTATGLIPLFEGLAELRLQEPEKQNRYKLSYYLPLGVDVGSLLHRMEGRLGEEGLKASLIHSVDEAAGTGLLDVLPAAATKLHAVEHLMRQQGFGANETVFAGDSGNDLPVITSTIPSVLVANAHPDTIRQARQQVEELGTHPFFYLAQGDFLGMNGNYSAGILEGIAHFHPPARTHME